MSILGIDGPKLFKNLKIGIILFVVLAVVVIGTLIVISSLRVTH
jgi:Tfp pilus assembly protein PilX